MNDYRMVLIRVSHRVDCAQKLQQVLTEHGCSIKTRLGIHEAGSTCGIDGLIMLQLVSDIPDTQKLMDDLGNIDGVSAKLTEI